jgi:predicted alpha/beta superfamily hydrolase
MGGLASLYAYFRFPATFGRAGVMSPSIWFGQAAVLDYIGDARTPRGRLYVDVGAHEGAGTLRDARRLARLLVSKGFRRERAPRRTAVRSQSGAGDVSRAGDRRAFALRYVEDASGRHNEASWARRLEGALAFLLE